MEAWREAIMVAARDEIGQKEVPTGSNWGGKIPTYLKSVGITTPAPWCFTGDTEILTEDGFVRFDKLQICTKVAQVDPQTLGLSIAIPIAYIRRPYKGQLVALNSKSVHLRCDPDHQFYGRWHITRRRSLKRSWPVLEKHQAGMLATGEAHDLSIPVPHSASVDAPVSDRDLTLLGAFICDGFLRDRPRCRPRISIQVSKQKKIDCLRKLHPRLVYRAKRTYGPRTRVPLTTFEFDVPPNLLEWFSSDKEKVLSPGFIWSLSMRQARILLDAVARFDGYTRVPPAFTITQSSKARIDAFHHLCVMAGYTAQTTAPRVRGEFGSLAYGLSCAPAKRSTFLLSRNASFVEADTYLYCVTVPSGLIVIRSAPYGRALMAGNCAAFVYWIFDQVLADSNPLPQTGYTPLIHRWAKKEKRVIAPPRAQPADIVLFHFPSLRRVGHVGIVGIVQSSIRKVTTIEGNTNTEGAREGHIVARKVRPLSDRMIFVSTHP